jgi:transglutaminase-like putative cysteine protease
MRTKRAFVVLLVLLTGLSGRQLITHCLGFSATTTDNVPEVPRTRSFRFTYEAKVKNLSTSNAVVRVWLPLAPNDFNQSVTVIKVSSPVPTRRTEDKEYGNPMIYAELRHPGSASATFSVDYEVTRREFSRGDSSQLMRFNEESTRLTESAGRFLSADRLVPIDGRMKELADQNTQGKQGPVEKAYALYDYVFHTLRYDKSGTGWGRGDSLWTCDSKRGNCTDFHSLFISLMRAEGIPSRFKIGFPLPTDSSASQSEIAGYHCWAEFYLNRLGWVPVDISEAWKNPSKHDYFFGSIDANRVQFTTGRDLTLEPKQDGPTLNYFIYPYVEVDGQPYEAVSRRFTFQPDTGEQRVRTASASH